MGLTRRIRAGFGRETFRAPAFTVLAGAGFAAAVALALLVLGSPWLGYAAFAAVLAIAATAGFAGFAKTGAALAAAAAAVPLATFFFAFLALVPALLVAGGCAWLAWVQPKDALPASHAPA
jgi:hypothetical protein